ncbi:MAG TPA: lytic transglycosylase domain-containing protein [Solirubrobacteraceae bacterium]|nr:lytic transglycosylase domain-containing protein [Solirubrobacteraceae bacterium]
MSNEPSSSEQKRRLRPSRSLLSALAGGGLAVLGLGFGADGAAAGETTTGTTTTSTTSESETVTQPTETSKTTTEATKTTAEEPKPPTVVLQSPQPPARRHTTKPQHATPTAAHSKSAKNAHNNVAGAPNSVAELSALEALLSSNQTSAKALQFYRIPLFLLPIYKAAAVQYGVPWQILAAINEIETDYGADQNVSSAGAVGWMQFMPETWLQYGVDALESGYADPSNPVDAIFAAARYLRAAGAQSNLREAILAYNHSEEYVDSVLLRAKLIATYPRAVLETLTGLVDGTLPVTGTHVAWSVPHASAAAAHRLAPAPTVVAPASRKAIAAAIRRARRESSAPPLYAKVRSGRHADAVAVQAGRVVRMGRTAAGYYIVLRDIYGDQYTYAGLGRLARTYSNAAADRTHSSSLVVRDASSQGPAPSHAASAGGQQPQTLTVHPSAHKAASAAETGAALVPEAAETAPAGMERVRLYAHPGNPDARAAAFAAKERASAAAAAGRTLRVGSVVAKGTVLGFVRDAAGSSTGSLSFAVRPAGDGGTIDPAPLLANWAQLQRALHPKGATATDPLLGATSSEVFLLSPVQLRRTVLTDSGIAIGSCERRAIASGAVDSRLLAVLAYLSRSGLQPTVGADGCSAGGREVALDITAINGIKIAHHQGSGTITDLTIRTLLTLPAAYAPARITSLMHYPGQTKTKADAAAWNHIRITFAARTSAARGTKRGRKNALPTVTTTILTPSEWRDLFGTIGSLQTPVVATRPSHWAIPDEHPLH